MALNKNVEKVLNDQINKEFWSAYLYLSMANYFEDLGFKGFANWMTVQFQEEQDHAFKIIDFINQRNGRVLLQPIEEVPVSWKGVLDTFEDTLAHEEAVTASINNCMSVALEEKDYAASNFLQWYVDEQVEEEANDTDIIDKLKIMKENGNGLYMLDKELAARTYVPLATSANSTGTTTTTATPAV